VRLMGFPVADCFLTTGTRVEAYRPPRPPSPFSTNNNYVEVVVSQPSAGTFFSRALGWNSLSPGARAVAGTGSPSSCVTVNGNLTFGNFQFILDGCGLDVGGYLQPTNPTAAIWDLSHNANTVPVSITETCNPINPAQNCSNMGNYKEHAGKPFDSLGARLTAPPTPLSCGPSGTGPSIGPGCYTNISAAVTTLQPGDYYITGTVNIDNLRGDDVFLYLTGLGKFQVTGQNKVLHLTAHTGSTNPYQGVVIWQDVSDTNPFTCPSCPGGGSLTNSFTLDFNGAIYMPGVDQTFGNAFIVAPSTCSIFVANNLTIINGSGSFTNTGCGGLYSNAAFLSVTVAE
jgi:hypothetical protein